MSEIDIALAAVRLYAETHPRPPHVTQKEAAVMLRMSEPTIRKLIQSGALKLNRAGARLLRPVADRERCFTLTPASLDALFRKARDKLLIEDLHFHDGRAEALTRLASKVDVMTLARISGHKDLRILMSTYYRETAEQIAARL